MRICMDMGSGKMGGGRAVHVELAAEATSAPSPFVVGIEIENQTPQRVVKHGELGAKGWAGKRGKWGIGKRQCGGEGKGKWGG